MELSKQTGKAIKASKLDALGFSVLLVGSQIRFPHVPKKKKTRGFWRSLLVSLWLLAWSIVVSTMVVLKFPRRTTIVTLRYFLLLTESPCYPQMCLLILCSTACIYGIDPPVTLIVYILNFATNLVIQQFSSPKTIGKSLRNHSQDEALWNDINEENLGTDS